MNITKRFIIVSILLLLMTINSWASKAEDFKNNYNDTGLQQLLDSGQWDNSHDQQDLAYWLFWVAHQKGYSRDIVENYAYQAIEIIEKNITSEDITAEDCCRLAVLYNSLIKDLASFIKYHDKEEQYLDLSLSLDPSHKETRIAIIRNLLFYPSAVGGDKDSGLNKLEYLENEYPDDDEVLMVYADFSLNIPDYDKAKDYYSRILEINPDNYKSKMNYDKLLLLEENLPINTIILSGNPKTRLKNKMVLIKNLEGETYNRNNIKKIEEILYSLPSITAVEIETEKRADDSVDLILKLSENNSKVYGIMAGMDIANSSDDSLSVSGFPMFMYIDQNNFGTGNELVIAFAGVYYGIDYSIPERSGFPLDLTLHTDGLIISESYSFVEEGKEADWGVETPVYNASVILEKNTDIGLRTSSTHNFRFNKFSGGNDGFLKPENNLTYEGDLQLSFSTIESGIPSSFSPPLGFSLSVKPSLVFKPDYREWGYENALFTHNDRPEYKLKTSAGYYKSPTEQTYIGTSLSHYSAFNSYESEKWTVGQTDMASSGPRLSGYLKDEYRSTNCLVANFDSHYRIVADRFLISAKHDVYFDLNENEFRQGSALGFALKMPGNYELNAEGGIGWNAERDGDPGWTAQIFISRFLIR